MLRACFLSSLRSDHSLRSCPKSAGADFVEPSNGFHRYTLSRRAPSTTRPPVLTKAWGDKLPHMYLQASESASEGACAFPRPLALGSRRSLLEMVRRTISFA